MKTTLSVVAALTWTTVFFAGLWLEDRPDVSLLLALATFALPLVVAPFAVGAAVAWPPAPNQHPLPLRVSAVAAAASEWAWLIVSAGYALLVNPGKEVFYLRNEWVEALFILALFGGVGALMGAAGGSVAERVSRRQSGPTIAGPRSTAGRSGQ